MYKFATKIAHFNGLNGTQMLEDGKPVLIWGLTVAATSSAVLVTFFDMDDVEKFRITTGVGTEVVDIPFVARNGLKAAFSSALDNYHVSIFYSQLGQ